MGINADNLSLRNKEEDWKKVINVNSTSSFMLCKFAIKKMLKNKSGKIVNITSIVGHTEMWVKQIMQHQKQVSSVILNLYR